ncbi:MAG: GIY-YIG nuclease family protein [Pyrinomonadaceae bacterium]|nr:GIY-YIG nuclease family protein [Pyrinomonadaceae bacterium]
MKVDQLDPRPTERTQFRLSSFKVVPKDAGCYVLATFENDILYIGLSDNLFSRFRQHVENPEKTEPCVDGKAVWFDYKCYNPSNLPKLERTWMHQYVAIHGHRPRFNKVDSPVG